MPINSFLDYQMSWIPDKQTLKRPIYLSIAEKLEQDIASGLLAPGTRLPPQRELADFLDINFTTITRAYSICERKGVIYAVTGKGTFVSPNAKLPITISMDDQPAGQIELGFLASYDQCNYMILDTVREVAQKKYVDRLLNYDDPTGIPHHKMAGLNWMKAFGIRAIPDEIAIAPGSQNALAIVMCALFEPGSRIAVDLFTYSNFIELARLLHIHLVAIPGDSEGMLPEELDNQCKLSGVQGVFLMPSCSNPTTVRISNRRKQDLALIIHRNDLVLIEDDIYAFLTAGMSEDILQPMYQLVPENTIYICGTSKPICSGLRVAYLVFKERFRKRILKSLFNINVKTSSLDVEILSELIVTGKAHQIVREKINLAEQANALFGEYFPEATSGHPLSFHRWLPLAKEKTREDIEAKLQASGVRVFHSDRFLCASSTRNQYLRIALSSAKSLDELQYGLEALKKSFLFVNSAPL